MLKTRLKALLTRDNGSKNTKESLAEPKINCPGPPSEEATLRAQATIECEDQEEERALFLDTVKDMASELSAQSVFFGIRIQTTPVFVARKCEKGHIHIEATASGIVCDA